jgi:hypothetical protein
LREPSIALGLVLLSSVFVGVACQGAGRRSAPQLLTPIDYITYGVRGVERFIADAPPEVAERLQKSIDSASQASVLVDVKWNADQSGGESSFASSCGTGVWVRDGKAVLTAAHIVSDLAPGSDIEVRYRKHSMSQVKVEKSVLRSSEFQEDWALLSVDEVESRSSLTLGDTAVGDLVVAVGFAGALGISRSDGIVETDNQDELPRPIPIIGRVVSANPMRVELVAGSMPPEGMSGSPIVDLDGRCVGVLSGVELVHHSNGDVAQTINATSVTVIQ